MWDSFSLTPLSGHTDGEIASIALSGPVRKPTCKKLNQASLDHVIAMRDQKLNAPQFLEAMKISGEIFLQHGPRFAVPECPQIHYISNQDIRGWAGPHPRPGYHTDHSNDVEPPKAKIALKTGGDTFANMYRHTMRFPRS